MNSIVRFDSPKHGCNNEPYNNNVKSCWSCRQTRSQQKPTLCLSILSCATNIAVTQRLAVILNCCGNRRVRRFRPSEQFHNARYMARAIRHKSEQEMKILGERARTLEYFVGFDPRFYRRLVELIDTTAKSGDSD